MQRDLAVFGGQPLFKFPRPVGQLAMPDVEAFLQTLKEAFDRRQLSSNGPLTLSLEERLCTFHQVRNCVTVANAGLGLIMLMRIFARSRPGEVVMPSFSYRGLPHFAQWAGQIPRFADVERETHGLNPATLNISAESTSVLAVNNFNSPCDIRGVSEAAAAARVPVFFDSVYGLGTTYCGKPLGSNGRAEVFSLHATKLLNGFEGGYVTTDDDDLAAQLRSARDTGFNAVLNEAHAAMALRCLDDLDDVVARNEERYRAYQRLLEPLGGLVLLQYRDELTERHNYEMAVVEVRDEWPLSRDETVKVLRAENIAIVGYYSPPLHLSPHAPALTGNRSLPVSEDLSRRFFQLPVGELTTLEDVERACAFIDDLSKHGPSVAKRLRGETA